jgi:hypothetical protein
MLDIALVSQRRGTIDHDAICGWLTECLQDVSFAIVTMSYLFARLGLHFFLLFYLGCQVD